MAVNEVRALLERHGHIVQEVDGGNDYGEDLYVTFVQDDQRTADSVALQVKGGVSTRTRRGHPVRVGDHGGNWRDGRLPVLCVVHDPERGGLFWANATRQLRRAEALRKTLKSVVVSRDSVLDDDTLGTFVQNAELPGLGAAGDPRLPGRRVREGGQCLAVEPKCRSHGGTVERACSPVRAYRFANR